MKIAILGGTGDIGAGLALRWAKDTTHEIRIGSRHAEKAHDSVQQYEQTLAEFDTDVRFRGGTNPTMTENADVVILAAPPEYVTALTEEIRGGLDRDAILVSPAVKIQRDAAGFHADPPAMGSLTAEVADVAPPNVPVVGAFHSLAAGRLSTLDHELAIDTLVVGNDERARETIIDLASQIEGLRGIDGGPLEHAGIVEALAPLCINVAFHNDHMHDAGIRFT